MFSSLFVEGTVLWALEQNRHLCHLLKTISVLMRRYDEAAFTGFVRNLSRILPPGARHVRILLAACATTCPRQNPLAPC